MQTRLAPDARGLPRLWINDQPHPGIFCSAPPTTMRNFIDAGFDIFDTHPLTPHGWVGPDQYDYTETDRRIESYLTQKRDALLIVRFWMEYDQARPKPRHGLWWCDEHPAEHVQTNQGVETGHLSAEPSFASQLWRDQAGEALRRVVEHIEQRYGDNVVAYVPGGGPCGEWFHWFNYGANSGPDHLDDYSPPMHAAWTRYLADRYDTIEALNTAWGAAHKRFDDVPLPSVAQRNTACHGHLRDAVAERHVIDFLDAFNRQTAETLMHLAHMTKRGCDHRKAVLAFYGYLWHHQPQVTQSRSGHLHLDMVADCPDVDAVVAPIHYSFRQLGGVVSGQAPVATLIRRGKQYVHELDGSTNLKPSWPSPHDNVPADADATAELMRRDLARTITQGANAWYMDLTHGMYDDPQLVAHLRRTLDVARHHALQAGGNNRQVAVVLCPDEAMHFRESEPLLTPLIAMFKQFHLERMGLDYDDLLIDDLDRLIADDTRQYRLWILPSCVSLTDAQWAALKRHACRNGNHVLFNYAPGVSHGQGIDLTRMSEITGLDCDCTRDAGELNVRVEPANHPLLAGVDAPLVYGTAGDDLSAATLKHHAALKDYPDSFSITPRFFVRDGGTMLGRVDYGQGAQGGLAIADPGDWASVLSVAPLMPAALLRNLAAAAGCHVYTDFPGQVVHCDGYLGMYFHGDGQCTFRLPQPMRVHDVWHDEPVAMDGCALRVEARANTAVLFALSPEP